MSEDGKMSPLTREDEFRKNVKFQKKIPSANSKESRLETNFEEETRRSYHMSLILLPGLSSKTSGKLNY